MRRHDLIDYDTIMVMLRNRVSERRSAHGWSQQQLADRSGLSRAAVSAIEIARVAPSTTAALALAGALACRVEDLFSLGAQRSETSPQWAWPPSGEPQRFWHASVGDRTLMYPVEPTLLGTIPCDGIARTGRREMHSGVDPTRTLIIAGCDPAVGLLAAALARVDVRVVPLTRSSRRALELLGSGRVHVAGIHLEDRDAPGGNRRAVRELLGAGYRLLRIAAWEEGIALAPDLNLRTIRKAATANLRWVGREAGSGARRCLDSIVKQHRSLPKRCRHEASSHFGVVEAIRAGWAQAGICVRLAAVEAGLDFLTADHENYDLCYRSELDQDPRIRALIRAVRSSAFRRLVGELPGYDPTEAGETAAVG